MNPIEFVRYATLEECMAAFLDCEVEELPTDGRWEFMDGNRFRVWPMSRVLRERRKRGTWGFCEDKKRLHLWVAQHASMNRVVRLVSHEIGHMQRPFCRRSVDEEAKAETYADVAEAAYEIALRMITRRKVA